MFSSLSDNVFEDDTQKYKNSCAIIERTFLERVEALKTSCAFEIKIEKLFFKDLIEKSINQKLEFIKDSICAYFANYFFDPLLPKIDLVPITNTINDLVDKFVEFKNKAITNARRLTKLLNEHFSSRDIGKVCKDLVEMHCLKSVLFENVNPTQILFAIEQKKLAALKDEILNKYSSDFYRRNFVVNKINQRLLKIYVYEVKLGIHCDKEFNIEAELKLLKLVKDISNSRKQLRSMETDLYIKEKFKELDWILLKNKYCNPKAESIFDELMKTLNQLSTVKQYSDVNKPNIFKTIYLNNKEHVPKKLSIFSNTEKPIMNQACASAMYTVKL